MNAINEQSLPAIGTPMPGGFFAGAINLNGQRRAIILAKKSLKLKGPWNKDYADLPNAKSFNDGMANTQAMAEAGSEIAKVVLAFDIDGLTDFYIPSVDELELCYRVFKPTAEKNWCFARSGINMNSDPQNQPYTPDLPLQISLDAFKKGGEQAFDDVIYWTSTQHAGNTGYAWYQDFRDGDQSTRYKYDVFAVRAVRSQLI